MWRIEYAACELRRNEIVGTLAPDAIFAERYEIISLLGRGGMGEVHRAEHLALGREVALKVLKARATPDSEARFEREARAIARLEHPSCVRILDYGTWQGSRYIAMELVDGQTLATALRSDGQFSTARAVGVTRNVLAALAHAHAKGVLHRDVKPENVMLASRGISRAVLIDFGLAALGDEAPLTASGMCLGSPSYIAPERLLGQPHDARADLYAAGVILYEMLAGTRPFVGSSPEQIMHQALHRPPRPLRAIRKDIPRVLDALITRALAKDPDKRFADAEDMLSALADVPLDDEMPAPELVAHDEQATTMTQLALPRVSIWARVWGWLRYGRWRWTRAAD
ncbi:MAG: serine/threonine protein kinase [Myxococcales bacterium]|nr:serine/threonine protein kinase [Myxococcales bacterium]